MEAVTGTKFTNGDLWETTKSGVYLCNLINKAAGIHSLVYLALVVPPRYTLVVHPWYALTLSLHLGQAGHRRWQDQGVQDAFHLHGAPDQVHQRCVAACPHIYIRIYTVTPTSLGKAVNPWACAVATPSAPQTSTRRGFRTLRSTPMHNLNPN